MTASDEADPESTLVEALQVYAAARNPVRGACFGPVGAVAEIARHAVAGPGKRREPHVEVGVRKVADVGAEDFPYGRQQPLVEDNRPELGMAVDAIGLGP